jgi:hypothetical protein
MWETAILFDHYSSSPKPITNFITRSKAPRDFHQQSLSPTHKLSTLNPPKQTRTQTTPPHARTHARARAHTLTHNLSLALSLSTSATREIKVSRSRRHQVAPNHENENCFCEEKLFKEVENCATIGGQVCAGDKRRRRIPIKWETRNTQESQGFLARPTVEQQQGQELSVNQQLVAWRTLHNIGTSPDSHRTRAFKLFFQFCDVAKLAIIHQYI